MSTAFADMIKNLCPIIQILHLITLYNMFIGTFDVQAVSITQIEGTLSLQIGCTFVENTMAIGCQLTVCRREDSTCTNSQLLTPIRSITTLPNLPLGTYAITKVVEIEQNSSQIIVSNVMLGRLETTLLLPSITTTSTGTGTQTTTSKWIVELW